jgi:hypothetical protein
MMNSNPNVNIEDIYYISCNRSKCKLINKKDFDKREKNTTKVIYIDFKKITKVNKPLYENEDTGMLVSRENKIKYYPEINEEHKKHFEEIFNSDSKSIIKNLHRSVDKLFNDLSNDSDSDEYDDSDSDSDEYDDDSDSDSDEYDKLEKLESLRNFLNKNAFFNVFNYGKIAIKGQEDLLDFYNK